MQCTRSRAQPRHALACPAQLGDPADTDERRRRAGMLIEQLDASLDDKDRARLLDTDDLYDEAGLPR